MPTETRIPAHCWSTQSYTARVNGRQHRRLAALAASVLMAVSAPAFAQDAPAKPGGTQGNKPLKTATKPPNKVAASAKPGDLLPAPEESVESKAAKGVVVIQRAGQPLSVGTVLAGDGRVLTALSPLGSGNDLEVRFPDDSVVKVKLGHHDRAWDLALLVPQSGKWKDGLVASSVDPLREDATIKAFSATPRGKAQANAVELRQRRPLIGGDDRTLENAMELGTKVAARDLGSPLIDEKGRVVGVLGRGCLPIEGKPCAPVAFGVPVSAVKSFLKAVPPDAMPPSAWLGIQGAPESNAVVKGVRVLSVAKGSPAAEAKLKSGERGEGDMVVAVGGEPVTTPEELAMAIRKRAVGEKVPLTLFSKGQYRHLDVVLRAPPDASKPSAPAAVPASQSQAPTAPKGKKQKAPAPPADDSEAQPKGADPFSEPL
jgi:serine protease Do